MQKNAVRKEDLIVCLFYWFSIDKRGRTEILHRNRKIFFQSSNFAYRAFIRCKKEMNEQEISQGCLKGNREAQRELYSRCAGAMLSVGMRYLADRETAEDVLHDVFIGVFTHFDKFTYRGEGSLMAWMKRVMVNASLDYLRRRTPFETVEVEKVKDEVEIDPSDVETVPTDVIMRFISELPDGYRTVFNLFTFEEKSHREIAELLGINEKSSSSQLSRAKTLLQKKIKEYLNLQA